MDFKEGQRFGRLVIEQVGPGKGLHCLCDCGAKVRMTVGDFTNCSPRRSCGCTRLERKRNKRKAPLPFHEGPVRVGDRYGKLEAIKPVTKKRWLCRCDCGGEIEVISSRLLKRRRGACDLCGVNSGRNPAHRRISPERERWWGMKDRCEPSFYRSHLYYDKGVRVCEEWKFFE